MSSIAISSPLIAWSAGDQYERRPKNVHTLCTFKVVTAICDHVAMASHPFHHHVGLLPVTTSGIPLRGNFNPIGLPRGTPKQPCLV